jgi:hypothetical protein
MDPDRIARPLLRLFNDGEDEKLIRMIVATDMGGECSTSDWLAILEALFDLRQSEQRTSALQ